MATERHEAGRGYQGEAGAQPGGRAAHLRRIEAVNPSINAVVIDLAEQARRAATAADRLTVADDDPPPLHGVPFTIVDSRSRSTRPVSGSSPAKTMTWNERPRLRIMPRLRVAPVWPSEQDTRCHSRCH